MKDKFIVLNTAIVVLGIVGIVCAIILGFAPDRASDAKFKHDCMERGGIVQQYQCVYTEKGALQ